MKQNHKYILAEIPTVANFATVQNMLKRKLYGFSVVVYFATT